MQELNIIQVTLDFLKEVLSYTAPAAFIWLLVEKGANAIIKLATGHTKGGVLQ